MRRLFTYGFLACAALLLAFCTRSLPPEDVLQRAMNANRNMRSARFTFLGTYAPDPSKPSYNVDLTDGILQDGGQSISFRLQARSTGDDGTLLADADMVLWQGSDLFIMPRTAPLTGSSGQLETPWWRYPLAAQGDPSVSTDPSLLRSQAEVVRVTADKGRETVDGRDTYHYEVTLDPEKLRLFQQRTSEQGEEPSALTAPFLLSDARGELWIDVDDFSTRRIAWTIAPAAEDAGPSISFRIDVRDVNDAPPIAPPKRASLITMTGGLLDLFQLFPASAPAIRDIFSPPDV